MNAKDLFDSLQSEVSEYNQAFAAMKKTQAEFVSVASDDSATDEQCNAALDNQRNAKNEWALLDQAMWVRAEKALGKGRELGAFWDMVKKAR